MKLKGLVNIQYKIFLLGILMFYHQALCSFGSPVLEGLNYPNDHHNIGVSKTNNIAVAVIAFNRPDCLAQVIDSLEKNPESAILPFYFFLDGGPKAKQSENIALINASKIKYKTIVSRSRNYGCAKNHVDAKRFMFDWCCFDTVIFLEDDLVVSPSFIHINLALHRWARNNYSNVGVSQCWSYCYLSKDNKLQKLTHVKESKKNWWSFVGYCMDKKVWDDIKIIMYEYESFVDQIPLTEEFSRQRSKPGDSFIGPEIRRWVDLISKNRKQPIVLPGLKLLNSMADVCIKRRIHSGKFKANQDITTGFALWMAGYVKLHTVVNRAIHIGEEGITTDKLIFERKYKPMSLDDFSNEDRMFTDFVVVE